MLCCIIILFSIVQSSGYGWQVSSPCFLVQGMVEAWQNAQGPLDQYGMQHTRTFANLCNIGVRPQLLGYAARL